jgi:hypothetical protein
MSMRTLATLSLAALLVGCGGGSSSSNGGGGGGGTDNGGVNGTYTGTFTPTSPAGPSFTVTALFTQAAAAQSPITGTATISPLSAVPACLGTAPLNVAGAEGNLGGLTMALINGPSTDGSKPKIDLPAPGSATGEFPDVSGDKDTSFSGPFSIENCPTTGIQAMVGTGTLTRQ